MPGPDFDPGPAFDPAHAEAPEGAELPPEGAEQLLDLAWEEDTVRDLLTAQGSGTHALIGVAEQDWLHTKADLQAIAPPLTRILNRYPATRAYAAMGDPLALSLGVMAYAGRSVAERRAALAARAAAAEATGAEPVTGEPAPPGSVPPDFDPGDVQWKHD